MKHISQIKKALHVLSGKLGKLKIDWTLEASGALMVWGIDIVPRDLDILVSENDFNSVRMSFGIFDDNSRTFQVEIENVKVEISKVDFLGDKIVKMKFGSDLIPVHPLEKELELYKQRNDPKGRIPLIQNRLQELKGKIGVS